MKRPELPRLLRTTAVRLAVLSTLGYTAVLGLLLAAFVWSEQRDLDPGLESHLKQDLSTLAQVADGGVPALVESVQRLQEQNEDAGRWYLLVGRSGERQAGILLRWPDASIPTDRELHRVWLEDKVIPADVYDNDAFCSVVATQLANGSRLLVAQHDPQAENLREITERLTEALAAVGALALVMGLGMGWTMLRRMDRIGRAAEAIVSGDLSQRVPVSPRNDEFDTLAARLNTMLDRIQQLIAGMREVTDNVAHDLRGPLTRLRNRLEVTLLEPRSESEYREAIARTVDDTDSLVRIFNALLGIAQVEAGSARAEPEPVDLATLANDLAELYEPAAEGRGQILQVDNAVAVRVRGHRHLLAQAIGNLLDNAVKYTPAGGRIELAVRVLEGRPCVSVSDTGPGIPQGQRERVLERFVRLEGARDTPGNGLGLSLVSAVCKLHGAELRLGDALPGLVVEIIFAEAAAN